MKKKEKKWKGSRKAENIEAQGRIGLGFPITLNEFSHSSWSWILVTSQFKDFFKK